MSEELPPGWTEVQLADIGLPSTPKINPQSHKTETFELYSVPSFESGSPETVQGIRIASTRQVVEPGDVLLCRINPRINRVWIVGPKGAHRQIASTEWVVVRTRAADPRFLMWQMRSEAFRERLLEDVSGVGGSLMRARSVGIEKLAVRLAPLAEQRRIVARIEALFARTRQARADLLRIAPLAARYRERLRLKAFDGDLVSNADDKAGKPLDLPDYKPPARFENLPDIPSVWRWAEIGMVSAVAGGLTKNQQRTQQPIEIPYLRVANVYADELRLNAIETIRVSAAERERVTLEPGDLLVVEGNGSVEQIGRVAVWDGSIPGRGHQNHLIRVRPRTGLPSRYLLHWLMSPYGIW